jgi:hypothetical protein
MFYMKNWLKIVISYLTTWETASLFSKAAGTIFYMRV